jgi:hypothetical protein
VVVIVFIIFSGAVEFAFDQDFDLDRAVAEVVASSNLDLS